MDKTVCLLDFNVWDEEIKSPYVDWAELKDVLGMTTYCCLLRFICQRGFPTKRKGLDTKYLIEFLSQAE